MEGYDVPTVEHQMNIVEDQPECYRDHGDSFDNNEDGFQSGCIQTDAVHWMGGIATE